MTTVLLIIQLLAAVGLVGVILMQRSEGGALGIGGGSGGMMSGRGAANLLTRTTMVLAAVFIGNSIALAVVTGVSEDGTSVFDQQVDAPLIEEIEEDAAPVPTDG
ncbi:MAG: preprotein translocase subunit SecG [Alphaproteobacteria bacterium]|nr:preprotein translocase subunit SecG [Alphaproteobacteria bacterium]